MEIAVSNPIKGHFFFIALFQIYVKIKQKGVISMILYQGRPENCAERLPKEIRVYDLLDSLGISYQRIDHEPAMTMEICAVLDR